MERVTIWTKVSVIATAIATLIALVALFKSGEITVTTTKEFTWENINVTSQVDSNKTDKQVYEIKYPQIGKLENVQLEPRINSFLKRKAYSILRMYPDWSEVYVDYIVQYQKYNLIGIQYNISIYNEGAAHPLAKAEAYSLNLANGSAFEFKDLFRSGYKDKIDKYIVSYLKGKKQYYPCKKSEDVEYQDTLDGIQSALEGILGTRAKTCYEGVEDNQPFFITDSDVVVIFPQYSISPGVEGNIEVPIFIEDIVPLVNPNGPLKIFI